MPADPPAIPATSPTSMSATPATPATLMRATPSTLPSRTPLRSRKRARIAASACPPAAHAPAQDAPIIQALFGDALCALAGFVAEEDLTCFRATCVAFRDHAPRVARKKRSWFLRSTELALWAFEQDGFKLDDTARMCMLAAAEGSPAVLAFLRAKGCAWDVRTTSTAARNGHLDALRWLREQGCPWNAGSCYAAAMRGHLHILEFAFQHGCDWHSGCCFGAAREGHLDVLSWLRKHGCPWDSFTVSEAARNGHLHVVQWALDNGCEVGAEAFAAAAAGGHLEVAQLLLGACPSPLWNEDTCTIAARKGHLAFLQWAVANGCPCCLLSCKAASLTSFRGLVEIDVRSPQWVAARSIVHWIHGQLGLPPIEWPEDEEVGEEDEGDEEDDMHDGMFMV